MRSKLSPLRRASLGTLAASIAFGSSAFLGVGMAGAQTPNPGIIPDPAATATLSVHKYLGTPAATASNGTPQTVALPALEGVEFTTYRVYTDAARTTPVDLTTNAGWAAAASINGLTPTPAQIAAGSFVANGTTYYLGAGTELATGATGQVDFGNLPIGLYLTSETVESDDVITVHDGATTRTVLGSQVSGAAPFFATLPMTDPDGPDNIAGNADDNTTWMYDVHAYPKNSADTIAKTVTDRGAMTTADTQSTGGAINAAAPHAVTYTLTSSIPSIPAADIGTYVVHDDLDPRVVANAVAVTSGPTALTRGTDYNVYADGVLWDGAAAIPAGANVQVVMLQPGITAMKAAQTTDPAATVVTTISTIVTTEDGGTPPGDVPNTANLMPSNSWWTANAPTGSTTPFDPVTDTPVSDGGTTVTPPTSNRVDTLFGDIVITKTGTAGVVLPGAVFSVYADPTSDGACSASDVTGTPLVTGVTTDAAGVATARGLQASNFYDGAIQTTVNGYCLVETQAPTGYNLSANPYYVAINASGDATAGYTVTDGAAAVSNQATNLGNSLPLTGGQGAAAVAGFSVLALLGAGGYMVVRRRQEKDEALDA